MSNRFFIVLVALVLPFSAQADALFGNAMAGDRKLPRTWGIGIDYFSMDQPYQIDSLEFTPDILTLIDPSFDSSTLGVNNDIDHVDLKVDVWVLPFLNLFGIYGQIDGETAVDLSSLVAPLPPDVRTLKVGYDGDVYGGGAVLAFGGEKWFGSVTATFTDTSISGDFNSTVKASTIQPRIGLRFGDHTEVWIGGYYVDAEEKHSGTLSIDLGPIPPPPSGPPIPRPVDLEFDVELSQAEDFNFSVGTHMMLTDAWEATIEVGGGERRTVLANLTYRFD